MSEYRVACFARTNVLRRALARQKDDRVWRDLLFLEQWEARPILTVGEALRVRQIRRAQPALAAAIRAELDRKEETTGSALSD